MIDRRIAIRNVYVMLAYAFRSIQSAAATGTAAEDFEHLHDLLAEILLRGVGAQVKRGLHRDYLYRSDELAGVRGRIDMTRTIARTAATRGRLVCEFDEYETDTPHNRALKSVMVLLLRHGEVEKERKDELRRLLSHLESVSLIAPSSIRWSDLTYHRATASYRLLLGVCELIVRGLLPSEDAGASKLTSWISDEAMSRLYERFLLGYFSWHHDELTPAANKVAWDLSEAAGRSGQLPEMRTDVTLRQNGSMLIIDAKYYGRSMQTGSWGKSTVHSGNLYQILAYVNNADVNRDGSVSGLLLYAQTDSVEQPDLDVVVQGNRIVARSLDLNRPWEQLRLQLEDIIARWRAQRHEGLAALDRS